jgi:hypothetical protein
MSEDDLALEQLQKRLSEWKNYKSTSTEKASHQFPTFSSSILNSSKIMHDFINAHEKVLEESTQLPGFQWCEYMTNPNYPIDWSKLKEEE